MHISQKIKAYELTMKLHNKIPQRKSGAKVHDKEMCSSKLVHKCWMRTAVMNCCCRKHAGNEVLKMKSC